VALSILGEVNLELRLIDKHTAVVHVHLADVVIATLQLLCTAQQVVEVSVSGWHQAPSPCLEDAQVNTMVTQVS
jgi:hypothetical protein